jgi:hypothetical protein
VVDGEHQERPAGVGGPGSGDQGQRQAVAAAGEGHGQGVVGIAVQPIVENGPDPEVQRKA